MSLTSKHHHLGMAVSLGGHIIHGVVAATSMRRPGKFLSQRYFFSYSNVLLSQPGFSNISPSQVQVGERQFYFLATNFPITPIFMLPRETSMIY